MKKNLFLLIPLFVLSCCASPKPVLDGKIAGFTGTVTVNGKPAVVDQQLNGGAVIETVGDSTCDINFLQKNEIRLLGDTKLVFSDALGNKKVRLDTGAIANVFNALARNPKDADPFTVETRASVVAVRGTVFFVKSLNISNTYICACNGSIEVTPPGIKEPQPLSSEHHKAILVTKDGNKSTSNPAELLYHDDKLMQSVADQVGYTIPWPSGGESYNENSSYD